MDLRNKVVMITGASEGIGAACADAFRNRGARLSLNALEAAGPCAAESRDVSVTIGDITLPDVRKAFVERTLAAFGTVDLLVNNAGIGLYSPCYEAPLPLVQRMFDVNVFAALGLAQLCIPHLIAKRHGCVVNVASVGAWVSLPWATTYCATKYALRCISEGMRRELAGTGVNVVTVYPGIVATRFREHVLHGAAPADVQDIRRVIRPEQLAEAIARGVERDARSVVLPRIGFLFRAMGAFTPWLMDIYLGRMYERELRGAATPQR